MNYLQRAKEIVRINFVAQAINELLGGGLETKAITEMFGEYRCSSLCLLSHMQMTELCKQGPCREQCWEQQDIAGLAEDLRDSVAAFGNKQFENNKKTISNKIAA